ncbi:hypothetical protein HGRIS_001991 [Hohenbuehelia grisea]|uniref:Uncharacterized protein n=1 Tax=Hohenbuehelia grisea TaxID=104357 RepID=A0ABR3JJS4_9AGAR
METKSPYPNSQRRAVDALTAQTATQCQARGHQHSGFSRGGTRKLKADTTVTAITKLRRLPFSRSLATAAAYSTPSAKHAKYLGKPSWVLRRLAYMTRSAASDGFFKAIVIVDSALITNIRYASTPSTSYVFAHP